MKTWELEPESPAVGFTKSTISNIDDHFRRKSPDYPVELKGVELLSSRVLNQYFQHIIDTGWSNKWIIPEIKEGLLDQIINEIRCPYPMNEYQLGSIPDFRFL